VGGEKKSDSLGSQLIQSKIKTETLKERGKRLKGSVPSASAQALARNAKDESANVVADSCPECGGKLTIEEGCAKCYGCGFSVCNG